MSEQGTSSRSRYAQYRRQIQERRAHGDGKASSPSPFDSHAHTGHGQGHGGVRVGERKSTKRTRTFLRLFAEFWKLLREHQATLIAALATLTVSTLLGLIPLYAPKLVFDNVLGGKPLSEATKRWVPWLPHEPRRLLAVVGMAMV